MVMTADKFERILASLRADVSRGRSYERRSLPRVGLRMQVRIVPCNDEEGTAHLAWLRDVSTSGICIVHDAELPEGSYFVALFPRTRDQALGVLYKVMRCQRVSSRSVVIGARLYRVLNDSAAA